MAKYTFGAAESSGGGFGGGGSFGSGSSFGKSSGAGVSRAPSVNPKDLDKEEEKVYREAFDKSFNPDLFDNEDEAYLSAAVDAEDVLFSFRGERRSQVENAAIKPEKIIGGWNLAGPQSSMPSLDPSKIEDPGDEKVYRQAFDESFNGNPDNDDDSRYIGAALNGEYALREKYGYANPKSLSMSEYAAMQNRAIDEREAYQAQKAEQGPLNQGPQNAAYMAAEQERMEREQRERDDAQTGAGARVQQIVAQKELERKLAEGSIRNEQLRQNAQRDLDNLRSMNEQGITLSQEGLAGVWQTVESVRNEPAYSFGTMEPELAEARFLNTLEQAGGVEAIEDDTVRQEIGNVFDALNNPESLRHYTDEDLNYWTGILESEIADNEHYQELKKQYDAGETNLTPEEAMRQEREAFDQQRRQEETNNFWQAVLYGGYGLTEAGKYLGDLPARGKDAAALLMNMWAGLEQGTVGIVKTLGEFISGETLYNLSGKQEWLRPAFRMEETGYMQGLRGRLNLDESTRSAMTAEMLQRNQDALVPVLEELGVKAEDAKYALQFINEVASGAFQNIGQMGYDMALGFAGSGVGALTAMRDIAGNAAFNAAAAAGGTNMLTQAANGIRAFFSNESAIPLIMSAYGRNLEEEAAKKGGAEKLSTADNWYCLLDGILNSMIELGGGDVPSGVQSAFDRDARSGGFWLNKIKSIGGEVLEEEGQDIEQKVISNLRDVMNGNMPEHSLFSFDDADAILSAAGAWDTMITTAAQTTITGAVYDGAGKLSEVMNKVRTGQTLTRQETRMTMDAAEAVMRQNGEAAPSAEEAAFEAQNSPEIQNNNFENAVNGVNGRPAPGGTDARAQAAVEESGVDAWDEEQDYKREQFVLEELERSGAPQEQIDAQRAVVNEKLEAWNRAKAAPAEAREEAPAPAAPAGAASEYDRARQEFLDERDKMLELERKEASQEELDAQQAILDQKKAAMDQAQAAAESAGPEAPITNEPAREESNLPPAETDVRTAEQRMREAQAAEVQAIIASNDPDVPAEERARRAQEANDASARRAAAEEEYRRAQAAADAAVKNQNDQVDLRNQEEKRSQQAQDDVKKAEQRLKRLQEIRRQAEETAKQPGLSAKEKADAEKKAGIARRQEQRAQEAYNKALKAADEQNQQADARKASDDAAQNSIDQMVGILQEDDQTNMNAQDVAPDQNRQAAERLQLEEEARAAEQRMQEARAAEVQAIVATNNPDMPEEEREQREQEARDAIARREEAENEYREAQAAVDELESDFVPQEKPEEQAGEFVPQKEPEEQKGDFVPTEEPAKPEDQESKLVDKEEPEQPESKLVPQDKPEEQKSELVNQEPPAKPEDQVGNLVPQEKPEEQKSDLVPMDEPAKPDDQVGTMVEDEAGEAGDGQGNAEQPKAEEPLNTLVEDEEEEAGEGEGSTGEEQPANEEENEAGENEGNTGETLSQEDQQLVDNANKHNDSLGFSHYDGNNWKPGVTIKTAPATLSKGQRSELSVFDSYAKKKGYTLVVHDQLFNEGGESVNGFYRPDEDSGRVIHVALDSENPLRSTMGHELYHMLKELNPEGAKRVAKEFARWANKAGIDINSLVRSKVELYYGQGYIKDKTDRRAWDYAYEEVVCDSLLDVIGDQQTVQALAIGDRNLVQRMRDWISKTMQQIHQMLSEYAQGSDEARILTEQEGALEKIREVFDKALDETNALQESKKAGRSLGSNSKMMDAYIKGLDAATTYSEANAEATKLAASVLKSQGLETSSKNINDVISMAQMMEAGYMLSEAAKELGIDIKSTPETERAVRALGRYVTSLLQQDKIEELEALYGVGESSDEVISQEAEEEGEENTETKRSKPDQVGGPGKASVKKNRDQEYQRAIDSGDVEKQKRLVDQAAKANGYDVHGYHGTGAFGFTVFDLEKGENLIFMTSDRRTAETYSGETTRSRISERSTVNAEDLHGEELLSAVKKNLKEYQGLQLMTSEQRTQAADQARDSIRKSYDSAIAFLQENDGAMDQEKEKIVNKALDALERVSQAKTNDELYEAWNEWDLTQWDIKWMDEDFYYDLLDAINSRDLNTAKRKLSDVLFEGDIFKEKYSDNYIHEYQLATELNGALNRGIYELYGKSGKQLVIDCKGSNWNQIIAPEELGLKGPQRTRDIAAAAKEKKYDSIKLINVRDNSDGTDYRGASDVYIFLDPKQVKSADLVTYDNDGKPIPLSERFNDKKEDIRWSAKKNQDKETSDKAADEKRLLEVETDIAGNDMQVWDLLKVMREMKRGQDAEGTAKGYWKKDIPKIVKTLEEEINSVGRTKEITKLVTEYFEDLDAFEGTTAAFMDYALQQGQALVTDLYRGEHRAYNQAMMQDYEGGKNAIRDFFRGGYWYISPAMKDYINTYIDSYRGFRRVMNAAGIRVTTVEGEKKSGHSVDLESAWKPRDPRTGRSDSNGLYEMLGGEETDSLGDIVQKVYDAITRESADEDVSLTMEEYDLTGKVGLTLVADYLQAGAMKEGARVSEEERGQKPPTEMDRLREETSAQRGVLQQKSDEIEQLNKEIDKLNNALSKEIGRSSKLAMQLKEMKRNGAAAEKLAQAKAELATANKEKQKAVNALEKAREKLDAQKDELNELKKQLRKTERAYDNALSQMDDLKERRAEQMENMKNRLIEKYKKEAREKIAQAKARQKATKHRRQLVAGIRNTGAKLKSYMAHPNATKGYIPQQNAERAAELIEIMMANDGRKSAAKAGRRLMDSIRDAKESPDYFVSTMYDDELNRAMQEVARILEDKQSLYNLDDAELEIVHKTLKAINHQIQNADKTIGRQKNEQLASEAADGVLLMQRNRESMKGVGRMIRKGVLTHLNPQRFFAIWGHHGDNAITRMGEEASEGQRKKNKMTMDMTKVFEGLTQGENEKKFDKFTGKNATWYDTGIHILDERGNDTGRTWKITEAMRTFFALSWQADENKEGMRAGVKMNGHEMYQLTIPDEELMKKGKEKEAYARGERVYFTEADANKIIGELTDYEKQWMTAWRDMEKISKQAINETSLLLNGFRKANVGNYVPIFRDPRYIGKEFETVVTDSRLTSMGFLKERVNSHLPMMLMDLKNVINRQVRDVSDYYGFAIPARNLTKIYNANFGGTSFKEVLNKTQGMEVGQYFEKLMADLQGGNRVESSPLDKLRGNVAGAVLSGNPSVIIKQAASYPAAASVLGWKPLLKGLKYFNPAGLKGINVDKIDQYTSALWERRSRSLSDLEANANRNTRMSKTMHWLTNGIQGMDVATTKVIWKAAEYYVDEHSPNLSRGTDEYNRAVARIYEQALEGTQPEYGTMQRPGILRSQSQIVKSLTMYKTQSLQNFNILVDAATNLSDKVKAAKANNSEENQAALKSAKRQMATALSSQITSAVILGVMTAVGKALLHKLGGYRDDKGDLTAESVGGQILKDSASSVAGMVAGGSELFDLINGLIEGQSPFDIEAAGVSTINDLYQNTYAFLDAMKVIGDGDLTDAQKLSQMWPKVRKLGLSVTQLLGLPVGNFANLIDGIAANAADFATGKPGSFASGSPLQISGTPIIGSAQGRETSNKSVAGYIAQAMMDGDEAEAMRLYNEQIRQGKSVDALNSAIASWQKANIPEIKQAAEAIDAGDLSLYNQLINELTGKGLSMTNAVKYVEAERKKMTAKPEEKEEVSGALTYQQILSGMTKETKTSEENSYTNGMMNSLLEDGNVQAAMAVRDDMLANGKTKSSISSSLSSFWKPRLQEAYAAGDMVTVRQITQMLVQMGLKHTTVQGWTSSTGTSSSSSSSKKSGFGSSGSFGSGSFGNSKKSSSKKSSFGSGSFGGKGFGK